MRPLRFCMVTTFYPPFHFGGDAIYVQALSRLLAQRGHSVDVVHCEDAYRLRGPPVEAEPEMEGIRVHRLQSRLGLLSPMITQQTGRPGPKRAALRRILGGPYDVINYHNISLVGGPAVLAMGDAPVKLYTTHEHWLVCPTHVLWKNRSHPCDKPQCLRCCLISGTLPQLWRYTGMMKRYLRHVDAMLAPSAFTAQRHREGGIDRPIHVLPLFSSIVPPDLAPRAREAGSPTFLFVGRLTRPKGVIDMVETFLGLPEYELIIAGDGDLMAPLQSQVAGRSNIRLIGRVDRAKLLELYQQVTAVVVPSIGPEVFGLVAVEAMACGTPVIVRQAGGSTETVLATGGGVAYQTPDELAGIVKRMATDRPWRDELARLASAGYRQHYTPETHMQKYLQIIDAVLASAVTQEQRRPAR